MLFSPRIRLKALAQLCRRQATALRAGIDVRTIWKREAEQATGITARARFLAISRAVDRGEGLFDALDATGDYFPTLMREMVEVGEQTGRLSQVFARLAEHYEGQLKLRRVFWAAIAWPMIELALAVVVVGCLIVALGIVENRTGTRIDPLGWGLVGVPGLIKYLVILVIITIIIGGGIYAIRRGLVWAKPIQRGVLKVPLLGNALRTIALARLAWTLQLTFNTEMDVRKAIRLGLRTTRNARYTDLIEPINADIDAGSSIHEAFGAANCLPADFLDAIAVGEQTGELAETMGRISESYQDQARLALRAMNVLAGMAVFAVVALVIILLIVQLLGFIVDVYRDVLDM